MISLLRLTSHKILFALKLALAISIKFRQFVVPIFPNETALVMFFRKETVFCLGFITTNLKHCLYLQ